MCDRIEEIRGAGAELVIIGNGSAQHAAWFVEERDVSVPVFTDPAGSVYRAVGARRGFWSSLGFGTLRAAWRAWRGGFRQTEVRGDPFQQGAVWIVRPGGEVSYRFTSAGAGDHPDPAEILSALRRPTPAGIPDPSEAT